MDMKTVKLKDLVDFSNGYAFKSTDYVEHSNTVNCRMSNIRPDGSFDIEYNIKYLPDEFVEKYKGFILNDGDIIIAMTDMAGDPKILGVPTLVNTKGYSVLMNQRVGKLTLKSKDIHSTYLKYYLMSNYARNYFKSFAGGGVQLNIGQKEILNIDIKLCNIEEQVYICNVLDKINILIRKKTEQLDKLDELVKSRFIEMFGNDNYPSEPLNNNVVEMFIGPFGSSLKNEYFVDKSDGYCMVYEQKHAIQKTMNVPTRYVPKSKYEELKRFTVFGGDIIVSCRGTIGEVFTVPFDAPMGIMHPSIMKIRLDTNKYNQKFFVFALEQYMNEHNAEAKGSGVKMAVSATMLGQADFVIPAMDVQNKFATFVEQTDKLKFEVKQSLEKLETLKKSLMQQYFG